MPTSEKIIEIKISEIDLYLINRVRDIRVQKNISQLKLALALGLSEGAISKIENPRDRAKYNIRHINLLAKALKVEFSELFPPKPLKNDIVILRLRLVPRRPADRHKQNYEIISKTVLKD